MRFNHFTYVIITGIVVCVFHLNTSAQQNIGIGTSDPSAKLDIVSTYGPMVLLNEGFESGTLGTLSSSGDALWSAQQSPLLDGNYSARSGIINATQSSTIIISGTVPANKEGQLSFWITWELGAHGILTLNNEDEFDGAEGWIDIETPLPPGPFEYTITLSGDGSGDDAGYAAIDLVSVSYQDGHPLRIADGREGAGKVLISDAYGNAEWTELAKPNQIEDNDGDTYVQANNNNTVKIFANGQEVMDLRQNSITSGVDILQIGRIQDSLGSISIGNSTATGEGALAWGNTTSAVGLRSTAFGDGTIADGLFSTAFGQSTVASGSTSTAWGWSVQALGTGSTAWGNSNVASGLYSSSWGGSNSASGQLATSWGLSTQATGNRSTAWGSETIAQGSGSTAWGLSTEATNTNATAWGNTARAWGASSTAWGFLAVASGFSSTAWGSSEARNYESTAWGLSNIADGERATAWGQGTRASGSTSTAWGRSTKAVAYLSTALGRYNVVYNNQDTLNWEADDPLFVIGNGTSAIGTRDAMILLKDGKLGIGKYPDSYFHVYNETSADARFEAESGDVDLIIDGASGNNALEFHENGAFQASIGWNAENNRIFFYQNSTNAMFVSNGNVGIKHPTPTYDLDMPNSSVNGTARAFQWLTYSDQRVKDNITPLDHGLSAIMALRPVRYEHYEANFDNGSLELTNEHKNTIGLLAQEVYDSVPEAVSVPDNENADLWGMDYEKLVPVLVKAIQDQQEIIEAQKVQLESQSARIDKLEAFFSTISQATRDD